MEVMKGETQSAKKELCPRGTGRVLSKGIHGDEMMCRDVDSGRRYAEMWIQDCERLMFVTFILTRTPEEGGLY